MVLPSIAEYALRALAHLAGLAPGTSVTAAAVAKATSAPPPYMSKILRRLARHGIVGVTRGRGGGFKLLHLPEEIRVVDVLRAVDVSPAPLGCAFGWVECSRTAPCPLHPIWSRLCEALTAWATTSTLADAEKKRTF